MNAKTTRDAELAPDAPDPQFAAHLEWQVRTSLRRQERFAEPIGDVPRGGRLVRGFTVAGVLVAAITLGACGVLAAQELVRSASADVLTSQYRFRFQLAQLREEAAREEVAELMRANEQGLVTPQECYVAEEKRIALAQAASVLGLDAIEVGYTGEEPDRRISAALVAGRDLVAERLAQERSALEFRKSAAAMRVKLLEQLREKGAIPAREVEEAQLLDGSLGRVQGIVARRTELRAEFLRGTVARERVELFSLLAEAEARDADARAELALAESEEQRVRQLHESGLAGERDLRQAVHALKIAGMQLHVNALEVIKIREQLGDRR